MNTYQPITHYLEALPENKPFLANALRPLASSSNARQILCRLVKTGQIERLSRGIFLKPKKEPEAYSSYAFLDILKTRLPNETLMIQGAEAANSLLLSTQVPLKTIFYTSGNTRTLKIRNKIIYLKHVNPSRLVLADTIAGFVISALYYIGKAHFRLSMIDTIRERLSVQDFQMVLDAMYHMPAWMADVFYLYHKKKKIYAA